MSVKSLILQCYYVRMKDKIESVQETLKDRYKLLGVLGEGGMSIVFKALDLRLNSLVAIKVLLHDPEGLGAARLQREAQSAARLSNTNVARIFNFGQSHGSDNTPYMVMELLEGIGLDKLIKERNHLNCHEALPIFKQICNGLRAAHTQHIVHRDLKPSNVILVETKNGWHVKIVDFGIAQIETDQRLTKTGALLGSPSYMSPEQIEGAIIDDRSDIYSLGCLMFETLTGQLPYAGKNSLETLAMHKSADLPDVTGLQNEIPSPLLELILKCLQKLPEQRPQNMAEIMLTLDQIQNGEIDSPSTTVSTPKVKSLALIYFVLSAILFCSLIFAFFAFSISKTKKETATIVSNLPEKISYTQSALPVRLGSQKSKFKAFGDPSIGLKVIGGQDIEDDDLKSLTFEKVDSLKIHSKELTGSGLRYLKNLKIRTLELKDTNITSENMKYLAEMPVLSDLIFHSPHIDDRALEEISKVKSLVNLNLDAGTFTEKGFSSLVKLPNLSSITLINLGMTDKDLEPLSKIKSLTVVRIIDCTKVGPDIGVVIAKLPKLDTVFVNHPMSPASYKALAKTKLRAFNLKNRIITPSELDNICGVKTLWRIGFIHARVTDDNYNDLLLLPKLGRFEISRTQRISDSLISTLAQSHIQYLDVSFSGLRPDQLDKLSSNRSLEQILCAGLSQISDKQLEEFQKRFVTRHHKPLQLIKSAM